MKRLLILLVAVITSALVLITASGFRQMERKTPAGTCVYVSNNSAAALNYGRATGSITATGVDFSDGIATVEVGEECSLAYTAGLTPAGSFTIAAWVNRGISGPAYIAIQSDSGTNNRQYTCFIDASGDLGLFIWTAGTTAPGDNHTTSGGPVTAGAWVHCAAVYTYIGNGSSTCDLYVNGVLNTTENGWVGPVYQSGNQPLQFQRSHPSTGATTSFDDTLVIHRALTATEIKQLYEGGRQR